MYWAEEKLSCTCHVPLDTEPAGIVTLQYESPEPRCGLAVADTDAVPSVAVNVQVPSLTTMDGMTAAAKSPVESAPYVVNTGVTTSRPSLAETEGEATVVSWGPFKGSELALAAAAEDVCEAAGLLDDASVLRAEENDELPPAESVLPLLDAARLPFVLERIATAIPPATTSTRAAMLVAARIGRRVRDIPSTLA